MIENSLNDNLIQSLCDVSCGACVRIKEINGDPHVCRRLQELGLCEHSFIKKISDHGTMICEVGNSRLALSKSIAQHIIVEEVFS